MTLRRVTKCLFQRRKFGSNKTDSEFCLVVIPPISEFEDCGFESCQAGRIFKYDVQTIRIFLIEPSSVSQYLNTCSKNIKHRVSM